MRTATELSLVLWWSNKLALLLDHLQEFVITNLRRILIRLKKKKSE